MTFKQVTIGSRVSAPRGPFAELNGERKRKRRGICYGVVTESVGNNEWLVVYDDGRIIKEKSTQLKLRQATEGRLPVPPVSPACPTPTSNPETSRYDLNEPLGAAAGLAIEAVSVGETSPSVGSIGTGDLSTPVVPSASTDPPSAATSHRASGSTLPPKGLKYFPWTLIRRRRRIWPGK